MDVRSAVQACFRRRTLGLDHLRIRHVRARRRLLGLQQGILRGLTLTSQDDGGNKVDILDELRAVQNLRGATFSSAEVLGMIGRAIDEIEKGRRSIRTIRNFAKGAHFTLGIALEVGKEPDSADIKSQTEG